MSTRHGCKPPRGAWRSHTSSIDVNEQLEPLLPSSEPYAAQAVTTFGYGFRDFAASSTF